jgi:hypothetical protein
MDENYSKFPPVYCRKLRADIQKIAVSYIAEHERHNDSFNPREEAYTALMRVAFGVAYEVQTKDSYVICIDHVSVPADWLSHICKSLPKQLQFGWLKPRFYDIELI